ncbi:glycosyltransferase family 2 protein [Echinicola jeungdonensis]|uniref:Cellulose synthase family protein n=1 Tax=Echinicola jeungdonensis TaxID=709343 RepID=A0ABV5J5M9_9BACT|nr:cellulose synthase family protein [Echinicola jeungdonensis]MDN3671020.1 glycosyltransferase family 2 protein [Echinicola jeungdonensis]
MSWILYSFIGLYLLGMLFIFVYGLAQAHLLYHFFKNGNPQKKGQVPAHWPRVTIQLPIFNEKYVAERLIDAISQIHYPKEKLQIQILDDSTDETSKILKERLKLYPNFNFQYIHRKERKGFKAGALKEGLQHAKGEFIAIFDSDFIPDPHFLYQSIPHFSQIEVGMVQSRWSHLNENYSLLTRLQAFALDAHFMIEQVGRNKQNAFINFNGTAGVWRKSCILDAGDWESDTLTEDLDLSYRAQKAGWKFIYLKDVESPAELPPVMSALKSQQFRWTKGGAECAVKHLKSVLKGNFPLKVKLHALAHLLNSTVFIAVLMVSLSSIPLWYAVIAGLFPSILFKWAGLFLLGFGLISLVYLVARLQAHKSKWKAMRDFIWEWPFFLAVSMGMALHNSLAVLEGLFGKKSPFIRTPKFNLEKFKNGKNQYLNWQKPWTTYGEGGLAILFLSMVILGFYLQNLIMVPFHFLLFLGYGMVFWQSFKSA